MFLWWLFQTSGLKFVEEWKRRDRKKRIERRKKWTEREGKEYSYIEVTWLMSWCYV